MAKTANARNQQGLRPRKAIRAVEVTMLPDLEGKLARRDVIFREGRREIVTSYVPESAILSDVVVTSSREEDGSIGVRAYKIDRDMMVQTSYLKVLKSCEAYSGHNAKLKEAER